jgi:hypothetical protein
MARPSNWFTPDNFEWSEDGYIRLTFQRFCKLNFSQRLTIADDDLRSDLLAQDVPAFSAGYCDWLDISTTVHVSVGWAWFATDNNAPQLLAPGGMSSNVMIMSPDGYDLGPAKTDELLKAWLSSQAWQDGPRLREVEPVVDLDVLSIH